MTIDDTNVVANYRRYHIRDIHKTARELSPEQKQKLLDEIQSRKGTCSLNGTSYNAEICGRIEKLLNGKRPK